MRILVVEDDPEMAENLVEILADLGHEADSAATAEQALDLLHAGAFDAVIADNKLPGRSGVDLLENIRAAGLALPVVVVSAFIADHVADRAKESGALEVMKKPLNLDQLFGLLGTLEQPAIDVLVVDDDAALAENIAEALALEGFTLLVAPSAEAALENRARVRVALLDLRLPDRSGIYVAQRLTARDPTMRFFFLTGYPEELQRQLRSTKGALAGIDAHDTILTKPIDLERLLTRVRSAAVE